MSLLPTVTGIELGSERRMAVTIQSSANEAVP